MYNKKNLLNNIIKDWEYKVPDGMPDIKKYEHRKILKNVMKEHGLTNNEINIVIQNLISKRFQLLNETDSVKSITDTNNSSSLGMVAGFDYKTYIDSYQAQNISSDEYDNEEDETELKNDNQDITVETYIFDPNQMKIVKTGNSILIDDVLLENKYKYFMTYDKNDTTGYGFFRNNHSSECDCWMCKARTSEIYYKNKNGTLIKEDDLNELEFSNKDQFNKYKSQHKIRDTTVVTIADKKIKAGDVNKEEESSEKSSEIINGKDKSLNKVDTIKSKNFNKPLYPLKNEFDKKNKKYYNDVPPPHLKLDALKKNSKIPKKYIDLLERLANTKAIKSSPTLKLSHFTNESGGAGTIYSQAGELLSMLFTTLDDKEFSQVYDVFNKHVSETTKKGDQILTKKWLKAAAGNRAAIHRQILNKFPKGTKILAGAWDTEDDVVALGMKDYKKNKGFTTDVYFKLKLPDNSEKLYEVTLKQSLHAKFLNTQATKFLSWNPNVHDSANPHKYAKKEREMVVNSAKNLNDKIVKLESLLKSGKIKNITPDMKMFLDAQKTKNFDSFSDALEKAKKTPARGDMKVIYYGIKALKDYGDSDAKKAYEEIDKLYRKFRKDSIDAVSKDNKLKDGLLSDIKREFPLKSILNKEENMVLGDYSLDHVVAKEIFKTDDFNKIKENLVTEIDDKGVPYLAYVANVNVKKKENIIPIAMIDIRSNGIGYAGNDIKFEMNLHPGLKKIIIDANKKIYK